MQAESRWTDGVSADAAASEAAQGDAVADGMLRGGAHDEGAAREPRDLEQQNHSVDGVFGARVQAHRRGSRWLQEQIGKRIFCPYVLPHGLHAEIKVT